MDRDSSVSIATRYGLDGPGIESRWEEIFRTRLGRPGAHSATCGMATGYFLGVKRPGRGADHPPTSGVEVKERVEPYTQSPSGPSRSVPG